MGHGAVECGGQPGAKAEGGDALREHVRRVIAQLGLDLHHGFPEHQVCSADAEDGAEDLGGDVSSSVPATNSRRAVLSGPSSAIGDRAVGSPSSAVISRYIAADKSAEIANHDSDPERRRRSK